MIQAITHLNTERLDYEIHVLNKHEEENAIIKSEQNNELNKNLSVFLNLNNEERILRQELVDKLQECEANEKKLKIANVVHQNKVRALTREEREKFVGSFAQAKNLIEKQMKIGNRLRDKKRALDADKKKVEARKAAKQDELMALPITTKQIDGMLFDEQMNASAYSDHKYRSSGPVKIKRGQS